MLQTRRQDEGATQLYRAYRAWPKNSALIKFLSEPGIKQELLRAEAFYLQDNQKEMPVALEPLYFAIEEKNKQVDLTDKGIALLSNDLVWELTDTFNYLMVLPNAIAIISLGSVVAKEAQDARERKLARK